MGLMHDACCARVIPTCCYPFRCCEASSSFYYDFRNLKSATEWILPLGKKINYRSYIFPMNFVT